MMPVLTYLELLKANREFAKTLDFSRPYRVVVLSNLTVNPLKEVLEYTLRVEQIPALVEIAGYDNVLQAAFALPPCDLVIVFYELGDLLPSLHSHIGLMSKEEFVELTQALQTQLRTLLAQLESVPMVLFNQFSALPFTAEYLHQTALDTLAVTLNQDLAQARVQIIPIERLFARHSLDRVLDMRSYYLQRCLYRVDYFRAYSSFIAPLVREQCGLTKKVLVLDCDETLWGGILGEEGIILGKDTPQGTVYQEIQHQILGLQKHGVLLALSTKNNPEDLEQVLCQHPEMVLRAQDFVVRAAHWQPKPESVRSMAHTLNLGLDAFVFVDDSPFEINMMREQLPAVAAQLRPADLFSYPAQMRTWSQLFLRTQTSGEDHAKTRLYQAESERNHSRGTFVSVADYLRSLELKVTVYPLDFVQLERIAQLTTKTNQFNLTTRRYTLSQIQTFHADPNWILLPLHVSDRFGEYGLTALAMLTVRAPEVWVVDTLLMSCRVLGRQIEATLLDLVIEQLRQRDVHTLLAHYCPTPKNVQVADFYKNHGFTLQQENEAGERYYHLFLKDYPGYKPDYIEVVYG